MSITQLLDTVFPIMEFTGVWLAFMGIPELSGVWIIWGKSGNGKTRFALMLAKYLTNFSLVLYNTLEEGARKSMQNAAFDIGLKDVQKRMKILNREPMEELKQRLRKRKSAKIILIDSLQYTGMKRKDYIALKEEFPDKLFIFISHAEGKEPKGEVAQFVRYDADCKLYVEGYKAFPTSRYGGGAEFVINQERAAKVWGESVIKND